jgi:hypothetical protein
MQKIKMIARNDRKHLGIVSSPPAVTANDEQSGISALVDHICGNSAAEYYPTFSALR